MMPVFDELIFDEEYSEIPAHMQEALLAYINTGRLTGDFLRAVLTNDLFGAVGRADSVNLRIIPLYVRWLYNRAPSMCYGNSDRVADWIAHHGRKGHSA